MNISCFEDSYISKKSPNRTYQNCFEMWVRKTKYIYLHLAGGGGAVLEDERSADVQGWSIYLSGAEFQGTEMDR